MYKTAKRQLGLYNALKIWFDPAMEGSPYDFTQEVKKVTFKQARPVYQKTWMTA
jgi:hypothetical protein